MRKFIDRPAESSQSTQPESGLNLADIADVEITSEHPEFPIEPVFSKETGPGWRAAVSGPQTIRLYFHEPQQIKQLNLEFQEPSIERTQEFILQYRTAEDSSLRDIVRQQWSFSPLGSTSEVENYKVELIGVQMLQLTILPDIQHHLAVATLERWTMA